MKQNSHPHTPPHKTLGRFLKTMRQQLQESLGETSGAVEIDVEQLDRFERGAELPSEDILMLLISHFGLPEDEAVKIWEMAGYDRDRHVHDHDHHSENTEDTPYRSQPMQVMLLALDNRVLYTNGVDIATDPTGLVMNFTHRDGSQPPYPVSRLGMSYDQAEQLLQTLQRALLHKKYLSGPKRLPPTAG